jgi:hypothetical protein
MLATPSGGLDGLFQRRGAHVAVFERVERRGAVEGVAIQVGEELADAIQRQLVVHR